MLEHSDLHVGMEFWTEAGRWRCTDVGSRTICAIKLEGDPRNWVGAGSRTSDEMGFAHTTWTYLEEEDYQRMVAERKATVAAKTQN